MKNAVPLSFNLLPSGAALIKKQLNGKKFFQVYAEARLSRKRALLNTILSSFELNGKQLDCDNIEEMELHDFANFCGIVGTLLSESKLGEK